MADIGAYLQRLLTGDSGVNQGAQANYDKLQQIYTSLLNAKSGRITAADARKLQMLMQIINSQNSAANAAQGKPTEGYLDQLSKKALEGLGTWGMNKLGANLVEGKGTAAGIWENLWKKLFSGGGGGDQLTQQGLDSLENQNTYQDFSPDYSTQDIIPSDTYNLDDVSNVDYFDPNDFSSDLSDATNYDFSDVLTNDYASDYWDYLY
jgi:hypothetical protein